MKDFEYYREREFQASTANGIYLSHAGSSPTPSRVVEAVTKGLQIAALNPFQYFMEAVIPAIHSSRKRLAGLMGVPEQHLALTKNTGHGLSIIADGLMLEPGDNVVTASCEYPAVVYPWNAQEWRGIETRIVAARPDGTVSLDDVEAAMDSRTRVITLSWVQFSTGFRADLAKFAELAHSHNAIIVVDVIQGLGAFPLNSVELGLDVVATGAHKWLMSPSGTGGLYIAPHVLERMHLVNIGAVSVVDVEKFDPLNFNPKPNAQRYEEGSPNALGLIGLDAGLSLLEEVGIERIAERVLALTAHAIDRLEAKGYVITSPKETDAQRSGIVMFRHPMHSNEFLLQILTDAKVTASVRGGAMRFAPHFYNTFEDMEAAVEALPV